MKRATIVAVPKETPAAGRNDYRPIALASVIIISFEWLVKAYSIGCNDIPASFDPLKFAHQPSRSADACPAHCS